MPITELVLRLSIAFITLLVLARLIGRKEISQIPFLILYLPFRLVH